MSSIENAKCILITGATSGIGRALALALVKLPSRPRVIAAGRRKERLEELSKIDGISTIQLELSGDPNVLKQTARDLIGRFPELDAIILNAGVQYEFDFKKPESIDTNAVLTEINTNYTSNVIFIMHILPHFLRLSEQSRPSFIITVSSGLGIVPFRPPVANYSATKAALHSFSLSLRAPLVGTNVNVVDIMPPLVESELHDVQGKTEQLSKHWMPLDQFISAVLDGLRNGARNIPVGDAKTDYEKFEKGKEDRVAHAALQAAKN